MLIRSQDNRTTVNTNNVKTFQVRRETGWVVKADEEILGRYDSDDKAFKVLNQIENEFLRYQRLQLGERYPNDAFGCMFYKVPMNEEMRG